MLHEPNGHTRRDIALALRDLRKAAGLSGERLAAKAQLSQSKISRIETGQSVPTLADTERILRALNTPPRVATRVLEAAKAANFDYVSWRAVAKLGIWHKQEELKRLAEASVTVRQFLTAIPSGLLQVPEYARQTLTPVVEGRPARDIERAVRARVDSQECLDDETRHFSFILTEQALRWRQAEDDVMVRQAARLVEISQRPNIDLAVLPLDAVVKVPARCRLSRESLRLLLWPLPYRRLCKNANNPTARVKLAVV